MSVAEISGVRIPDSKLARDAAQSHSGYGE